MLLCLPHRFEARGQEEDLPPLGRVRPVETHDHRHLQVDTRERIRLDNPFLTTEQRTTIANAIIASGCRPSLTATCNSTPATGVASNLLTAGDVTNINNGNLIVLGNDSWTGRNGWDAGGGLSLLWGHSEVFVESRVIGFSIENNLVNCAVCNNNNNNDHARQVPIVVGFNWYSSWF